MIPDQIKMIQPLNQTQQTGVLYLMLSYLQNIVFDQVKPWWFGSTTSGSLTKADYYENLIITFT